MSTSIVPQGICPDAWAKLGAVPDKGGWVIPERDADGVVIGHSIRLADGKKSFRWGEKRGLTLAWPLANYAGSSPSNPIFIVEGATDVAAGLSLGVDIVGRFSATGGGDMLATLLRDRHVCFIGENDGGAGRDGPARLTTKLSGAVASIRTIFPPEGIKDLRQWKLAGATKETIMSAAANAPKTVTAPSSSPPRVRGPVLIRASTITPREVRWLWDGRFALGRLSLFVGHPGVGKSLFTCDLAARVTRGVSLPDGSPSVAGPVIFITAEDDQADTIVPRLIAAGADLENVHFLRGTWDGKSEVMFSLTDIPGLEDALAQIPDVRLVVVDPIGSFIGGEVDAHRDNQVRGVLAPVAKLAQDYDTAFLIVAHSKKGEANRADDLALGSRAFVGICRSVFHLFEDPDNPDRRLLLAGKSNVAKPAKGMAFSIEGKPPKVLWETALLDMTADDLVGSTRAEPGERAARTEAMAFLAEILADGPKLANECKALAKAAGISPRTLDRARKDMKIQAGKMGFNGGWAWRLASDSTDEERHSSDSGVLRADSRKDGGNVSKDANAGEMAAFEGIADHNDASATTEDA